MREPKGITCPTCRSIGREIIESRPTIDAVRRRSVCTSCGERFTTYERLPGDDDSLPLMPVDAGSSRLLQLLCTLLDRRRYLANSQILDTLMLARCGVEGRRVRIEQLCEVIDCPDPQNTYARLMGLRRNRLIDCERGTPLKPGYLIRRVGPA